MAAACLAGALQTGSLLPDGMTTLRPVEVSGRLTTAIGAAAARPKNE